MKACEQTMLHISGPKI